MYATRMVPGTECRVGVIIPFPSVATAAGVTPSSGAAGPTAAAPAAGNPDAVRERENIARHEAVLRNSLNAAGADSADGGTSSQIAGAFSRGTGNRLAPSGRPVSTRTQTAAQAARVKALKKAAGHTSAEATPQAAGGAQGPAQPAAPAPAPAEPEAGAFWPTPILWPPQGIDMDRIFGGPDLADNAMGFGTITNAAGSGSSTFEKAHLVLSGLLLAQIGVGAYFNYLSFLG